MRKQERRVCWERRVRRLRMEVVKICRGKGEQKGTDSLVM